MRIYILTAAVAALVLGFVAGARADDREADRAQILKVWQELDRCNNEKDGAKVVAVFSKESFANNERLVKAALDGTKAEVKALGVHARMEVIRMRMKAKVKDLEKLDGKGYVRWATSEGWYVRPPDERVEPTFDEFRFNAAVTEATARLVEDGEPSEMRFRFVKEEKVWKLDEAHAYGQYDKLFKAAAKELKVTEDRLLMDGLEEEMGKEIPESVWEPMRKGKEKKK